MRRLDYITLIALLAISANGLAQTYPSDFSQILVVNGISNPTAMAFAPDGRIFVAQQNGRLRVIKNNALLADPFVALTVSSTGERGLIGIALHPDFETNQFVYLYYTVPGSPAHNRISRFTADGDVVLAGSEVIILELDPLSGATNHNGGAMHFGLDGKLYVAIGENANTAHAQNLDTYHGKILRINDDGTAPPDNPFPTGSEQRKRVWAYGLRNPYTFSVHPVSGRILVNDVGQGTWEEVDDATEGGRNFGWPTTEGNFNTTTYPAFTNPVYAYSHGSGDGRGCAITGGTFFHPETTTYPAEFMDHYFFQDLCNAWINQIDPNTVSPARNPFATGIPGNSLSLMTGLDGNLYFLSRNAGALYKITYNASSSPVITTQPVSVNAAEGSTVTLSVTASGSAPITYQWYKDGQEIAGATSSSLTITDASSGNNGSYTVEVSNGSGTVVSESASVTVSANARPVASVGLPLDGTFYVAGTTISFSGTGTDAEDGELPASAMSWNVNFHHDTHVHDEPAREGISSGTFEIPREGETSDNVWYRIILTVTDSDGNTGKDSVDILPRKSTLNFTTSPPGLQITLDGQPFDTPSSVIAVQGTNRIIGVITPQVVGDVEYTFVSWSNDGEPTQTITTPTENITFTAQFSIVVGVEDRSGNELTVVPNPVLDRQFSVHVLSKEPQLSQMRVVDPFSREIHKMDRQLVRGANEILVTVPTLSPGIYMLLVDMDNKTAVRRFVVR